MFIFKVIFDEMPPAMYNYSVPLSIEERVLDADIIKDPLIYQIHIQSLLAIARTIPALGRKVVACSDFLRNAKRPKNMHNGPFIARFDIALTVYD